MKYLVGATHYIYIQLSDGRQLYLFGDFHTRSGVCPEPNPIHLKDYLYRVIKKTPRILYNLFIEISNDFGQKDLLSPSDIGLAYNFFVDHPIPNLKICKADIRIKGVYTQMTRFLKAWGTSKHMLENLDNLSKEDFREMQRRFVNIVESLSVDYEKLWKKFGFQDTKLYEYFKKEFSHIEVTPKMKKLYIDMIMRLDKNDMAYSISLVSTREFKSMRAHFSIMGALFQDLYLCGSILATPPHSRSIVYFGSAHYKKIKKFFADYEMCDQCQSDQEQSLQNFKCLPLEMIQKNLR